MRRPVCTMATTEQPATAAGILNSETAAKLIMCTPEWLRRLTKDGWIKKVAKDQYRIVDVVQGHINYLKDENRKATKTAAASRVQDARATEIELRVARETNQMVDIDELDAILTDYVGAFRSDLSGVPAASTRDLALREIIEKNLNEAIERCRRGFETEAKGLRSGRRVAVDAEEADA